MYILPNLLLPHVHAYVSYMIVHVYISYMYMYIHEYMSYMYTPIYGMALTFATHCPQAMLPGNLISVMFVTVN